MGDYSRLRVDPYADAQAQQRAQDSADRKARARALVTRNGGRSAPQASPPSGLTTGGLSGTADSRTPESTWREMFRRDPAKEAAANTAVAGSRVRRDINSLNAYSDGAIAASPAPYMPSAAPLRLPAMKAPEGMASGQLDAWADDSLARNQQMTQPGGLSQFDPTPPTARPRTISAYSRPAGQPTTEPASWQEKVAIDHPTIHEAGTPENIAFVDAVRRAHANGEPIDENTMSDLAKRVTTSIAAERAAATGITPEVRQTGDLDKRRITAYA